MRALTTLILTVCGFLAIEFAIFHTDVYYTILRYDSSTGSVETTVRNERNRRHNKPREVLAIGDSRMGGFLPRLANGMPTAYEFASIALGGSTPRDWYYMLRAVDPHANRYSAIVIALGDYEDTETAEDLSLRAADLSYLIGRLNYSDIPEFARSFRRDPALEWAAIRGIVLKGLIYKRDFQDFLLHPQERIDLADQARKDSFMWVYTYIGPNKTMEGVTVDWKNRTLTVPPEFTDAQKAVFQVRFVTPLPPYTGVNDAYYHQWLGKIYEHYNGSNTRLFFLRLPRGPFIRPDQPPRNPHSSVHEMHDVILLPEHFFDSIEQPRYFIDHMHMNGPGSAEFTRLLADEVSRTLDAF